MMIFDCYCYEFLYEMGLPRGYIDLFSDSELFEFIKAFDLQEEIDWSIELLCDYEEYEPLDINEFANYEEYLAEKYLVELEQTYKVLRHTVEENCSTIYKKMNREFYDIFEKYDIWFQLGEDWSFTCFYGKDEYLQQY